MKFQDFMGKSHKVRSFFNNIADPNNTSGDVTIDTHAVAAAHLKPYSQNAIPVHHAFGTSPEKSKKPDNWKPVKTGGAATGISGTDFLYQEAYRRAAKERGILPRQMQSIAWEGVRALFPNKRSGQARKSFSIWNGHHEGHYDAASAREQIYNAMSAPQVRPATNAIKVKPSRAGTDFRPKQVPPSTTLKRIKAIR
jgi:hypothetical protein